MIRRNEVELLNSQSEPLRQPIAGSKPIRVVGRRCRDLIFIGTKEVLAFEAANRLTYVHCTRGRFDIDTSLKELQATFEPSFLRTHRNWLVHSIYVRELRYGGQECVFLVAESAARGVEVPVACGYRRAVHEALLAGTIGLRPRAQRSFAEWNGGGQAPPGGPVRQSECRSTNPAVATA